MRPAPTAARLAAAAVLLAGCHAGPPAAPPAVLQLPEVARQVAPPDVTRVAAALPPDAPDAGPYSALGPDDCRRMACRNASAARLIAAAGDAEPAGFLAPHSAADDLRRRLAGHLAGEARTRAAAGAVEVYYRLLEAELLADSLTAALVELDALVGELDALQRAGFREPADAAALRTRQFTARSDREKARAAARRLNAELLPLIGVAGGRVNPTDVITVPADDLDEAQAVAVALAQRPDVSAVRLLERGLDAHTITVVQAALAALAPGLPAAPAGPLAAVKAAFDRDAVSSTRSRLADLRADRERAAAAAVRAAVTDWRSGRAAVATAKVRVEQERVRAAELEAKRAAGLPAQAELRRARLAAIEADADVTRAAVRWKLADVAVRRELGLLCGG